MKKVAVEFTFDTDIIMVPDDMAIQIKKYQGLFDKWLYNKKNNHGYWMRIDGKKEYISFDTEAFVEYLNQYHLSGCEEKASIVDKNVPNVPSDIPHIWF